MLDTYIGPVNNNHLTSEVTLTDSDASFGCISLMPVAHGLCIGHLNCRSFLPHKEEIFDFIIIYYQLYQLGTDLLCNFHLDVLTLTECSLPFNN